MEKIKFTDPDTNETIEFYVLEQTTISGANYLLVAEDEEEDSDAYIMKEVSSDTGDTEATYVIVEDDQELEAIAKVFSELIEDVDIEY